MAEGTKTQSADQSAIIEPQAAGAVTSFYFNGFSLGLSNADVAALLLTDGRPIVKLNMSFTTAKTLASFLSDLVQKFEIATQHQIMTTEEVTEGLKKFVAEPDKGNN